MLLSITLKKTNATDLGYLLHKNPAKLHSFELTSGKAYVFFSEKSESVCTACLMLDMDPIKLVRGKGAPEHQNKPLYQYVNDRPYVPSSFVSSALTKIFGTALSGRCKEKPELASEDLDYEIYLPSLPCRGGERFLRSLFEPLGYGVKAEPIQLDTEFNEWGRSRYFNVSLVVKATLKEVLSHLYVLIPALDNDKHFWVGKKDIELLLRRGEGWIKNHPQKEEITHRFLRNQKSLARIALEQLVEEEETDLEDKETREEQGEAALERKMSLNSERIKVVKERLTESKAQSVMDLGCGEGKLLSRLLDMKQFHRVLGMDVSARCLDIAAERLKLDRMPERKRQKLELIQGSLIYRDDRLRGFDAATIIEVIEHMDLNRLDGFERVIFEHCRPKLIIVTTPNIEFNKKFDSLEAGKLRHDDHRFEWTRAEFEDWAQGVARRHSYAVEFSGIGEEDLDLGHPTQMGVFQIEN